MNPKMQPLFSTKGSSAWRWFLSFLFLVPWITGFSQIWGPEGLNMPGGWNSWNNPPYNNLALASSTQVPGGRVIQISVGIPRWQTQFSVAESGGDLIGGNYAWLFTSGPSNSPWNNKWASVNVVMNTLQMYTKEGGSDNTITVVNGKWYTMNFQDTGYVNTRAIFMETSAQPVEITSVSGPAGVNPGESATITLQVGGSPSPEEIFYIRYSADAWVTSTALAVSMTGTSGSVLIPGLPGGTTVSYYAFSSVVAGITSFFDLYTISMNTNGGANYSYTVQNPVPVITFANLDNPATIVIEPNQDALITGKVEIPGLTGQPAPVPGLEAWVGWSPLNTDPSGWTNWVTASYQMPSSFFDVFLGNLGPVIPGEGTWYYATRFRYLGGAWAYGGYSATGGGLWNGTTNVSGVMTVLPPSVPVNRNLTNVGVNPEEILCFDATQTITVAGGEGSFKVFPGGSVTLIAGKNIRFLTGTAIGSGGYLHGYITETGDYCDSLNNPARNEKAALSAGIAPENSGKSMIYPNPAGDVVNVRMREMPAKSTVTFELFSLQGILLKRQTFSAGTPEVIDLTKIPAGVCLVRLSSGDQTEMFKLIRK